MRKINVKKLTVITPTYNRAYILEKCYNSLINQSCKDFLWLVVDDGSSDNTDELISKWKKDSVIEIQYLKKKNGGKASALNLALDNLNTPFAVCLDSDDYFYKDTVRIALKHLQSIKDNNKCCGLLALRNNPDGTVMGDKEIPDKTEYATAADIMLGLGLALRTELICFYKSEKLLKFRFPQFEKEKYVSPSFIQYQITRKDYFKVCRERLCCCEYLDDGLTRNKDIVIIKNPRGYTCIKRLAFEQAPNIIQLFKQGIMYDCGCIISRNPDWLRESPNKLLSLLLYPLGFIAYLIRFKQLEKKIKTGN